MIAVRVRDEDALLSTYLCEWPADQLDALIPTLKRWGGVVTTAHPEGSEDLYGQFVLDEDEGYFEVVVA